MTAYCPVCLALVPALHACRPPRQVSNFERYVFMALRSAEIERRAVEIAMERRSA